jgi:hypothetical protein
MAADDREDFTGESNWSNAVMAIVRHTKLCAIQGPPLAAAS